MSRRGQSRRQFLRRVAKSAAASPAFPLFTISGTRASGNVLGANNRIRHAVVGINGHGQRHIKGMGSIPDVDIVYLVDPDSRLFGPRSDFAFEFGGVVPRTAQDIRTVLDDSGLDSISVAACSHWNALSAIWACQAGKDVFVEKPLGQNFFEGRQVARAAEKHGRVVQHGTQQRTSKKRAEGLSAIRSGDYGKLLVAKGYCCKPRPSIGSAPRQRPPRGLDFNLWLGPAPRQAFHENLVHYNWHWFWDFGGGEIANQGIHELDVARWSVPGATLPKRVWCLGGRFGPPDDGQTPNTRIAVFEHDSASIVYEIRGVMDTSGDWRAKVLNEFHTTEGILRGREFSPSDGGSPQTVKGDGSVRVPPGGPYGSFFNAMRTRKKEDNAANALVGHYSAAHAHLANISYKLGIDCDFQDARNSLPDLPQVRESFDEIIRGLEQVGLNERELTFRLGKPLDFDSEGERFPHDAAANSLLSREYRQPFEVLATSYSAS